MWNQWCSFIAMKSTWSTEWDTCCWPWRPTLHILPALALVTQTLSAAVLCLQLLLSSVHGKHVEEIQGLGESVVHIPSLPFATTVGCLSWEKAVPLALFFPWCCPLSLRSSPLHHPVWVSLPTLKGQPLYYILHVFQSAICFLWEPRLIVMCNGYLRCLKRQNWTPPVSF